MFIRCLFVSAIFQLLFIGSLQAEDAAETKSYDPMPMENRRALDLTKLKKTRLTEDQAVQQMKFMIVEGWKRISDELVESGSFAPIGLVVSPTGEFKAVVPDRKEVESVPMDMVLGIVVKNMTAIAQSRTMFAVGVMYIRAIKQDDGEFDYRIIVMAEHIAGWARTWSYPFKVVEGEVKMGKPRETEVDPIYYVTK